MKDKLLSPLSARLAVCLLGLSLVQAACFLPTQQPWAPDIVYVGATTQPAPAPSPTATPLPPTPTIHLRAPTHTPFPTLVPSPTRLAFYDKVSFTLDPALASGMEKTVYKEEDTGDFGWPEYASFRLVQYPYFYNDQPPCIEIFPVDDFTRLNLAFRDQLPKLQKVLDKPPKSWPIKDEIPVPTIYMAAQAMRAQVKFLDFQSGKGVRFITYYVQNAGEAANNNIVYTYQGITRDGKYHIAVFLPVAASILADKADDTHLISNFPTYTSGITRKLNALTPAGFTPNLNTLDALVQSIEVK